MILREWWKVYEFIMDSLCKLLHLIAQEEIELGNGLPDIRSTRQVLEALRTAGFEV